MHYRPEIDGLRAVAVLPVILFHAGFAGFSGGFVGVDVFFVISGYLITGILLDEMEAGRFSLVGFWERRARRILPALFAVLAVSSVAAALTMDPGEIERYSKSVLSVATFWSNIRFWQESGYFDTAGELKPLLHTWSLAVEEQYYILFPPFLALVWRFGRRFLLPVLIACFVVSLAISEWAAHFDPAFGFYWLPARAFELGIGVFAALYLKRRQFPASLRTRNAVSLSGVALIVLAIFLYDAETPFPGLAALFPTLGAGFVILAATPGTIVHRLLSARPLVGIGLISYSAYLWHQPLFAFARIAANGEPAQRVMALLAVASLALAVLSWRFIEQPFRSRNLIGRSAIFRLAATAATVFIALGATGMANGGYRDVLARYRLPPEATDRYEIVSKSVAPDFIGTMFDDGACRIWIQQMAELLGKRVRDCFGHNPPPIVVFGDSHAMNIYNAVARSDIAPFVIGAVLPGCRPPRGSRCDLAAFERFLDRYDSRLGTVLFHQSGSYFVADNAGKLSPEAAFEGGRYTLRPDLVRTAAAYLEQLSAEHNQRLVWVGPFPEFRRRPLAVAFLGEPLTINPASPRIFFEIERMVRQIASSYPGIQYVPFSSVFAIPQDPIEGNCFIYMDGDHLSRCGEGIIARSPRFQKFVRQLMSAKEAGPWTAGGDGFSASSKGQ
nr:acyltransferase family protein [Jiella endophytica]